MMRLRKTRAGFTLIELMIVVAILGILAVVAIPAFVRYMRNAKTAEAYRMINKIRTGLMRYFQVVHHDSNGQPVQCQFPLSQSPTPSEGECCTDGEADGKCEPNETRWNTANWSGVLFKISDKHYYSYGFRTAPLSSGGDEYSSPLAIGDLDCDGTYSTFFTGLNGKADAPTYTVNCRVGSNGAGLTVMNESE